MTVFTAASQFCPDRVTYALRTAGDPLRYVRVCMRSCGSRFTHTRHKRDHTGCGNRSDDQREVTFAKLCTGFAVLALLIACVGLYGTMSYNMRVARAGGEFAWRWGRSGAGLWDGAP